MQNQDSPEAPRHAALIVDDDPTMLEIISTVLRDAGFDPVIRAINGVVALERVKDNMHTFDIIICDWMMPGMSGLDLLVQVRAVDRKVPFLMLTSRSTIGDVQAAKSAGVSAYISKPFNTGELRRKVMALVGDKPSK